MGEYAYRKKDGQRIKIGTCESMYYCRYDQRKETDYPNIKNLLWRIPAYEEDGTEPGDYEFCGLVGKDKFALYSTRLKYADGDFAELASDECKGIVQTEVKALGILINVPCYHGLKLPQSTEEVKFFFNGRRDPLFLEALKNTDDDLRVVVSCSACCHSWSFTFEEIHPHIMSLRMLLRLWKQVNEYRIENGVLEPADINGWKYKAQLSFHDKDYSNSWKKYNDMEYTLNAKYILCTDGSVAYIYDVEVMCDGHYQGKHHGMVNDWDELCKKVAELTQHGFEW